MICLFLHVPAKPGFVHKYTPRSPFPELIDMKTSNSLAKEIMKFGKPAVLNSMRHVTFLAAVDGVSGVKVSRVLSMPLKEVSTGNVFGVIHFINKVCIYIYICVCLYVYMCMCVCMCMYIYRYLHIYIYPYI
jgi:hypothetical protein